jgi:small-conductance mechanosensitive channel
MDIDLSLLTDYKGHPFLTLALSGGLALCFGYLVQAVGRRLLERITAHFSMVGSLVRATAHPMQWVMPLLFLQLVLVAAPDDLASIGRIRHFTGLVFIAAVTWLIARCIAGAADTIVALSPLAIQDNLHARRIQTQTRVISRSLVFLTMLIGVAIMLMTFPEVRTVGTSLLASAGLAGIVAGVAARPVLSNMIAGLQIAVSQPIRLDDVLVVQGEWGRVEEISGSYVVLALWDQRRLIVPLQWFIENPFQNWTRSSSEILGTVWLWVDYRMPLQPLREELARVCKAASEWDGRVQVLQATEATERALQLRLLVSSADSSMNWDLRCKVREALIDFMQKNYPDYLPRQRTQINADTQQLDDIFAFNRKLSAGKDAGNGASPSRVAKPKVAHRTGDRDATV